MKSDTSLKKPPASKKRWEKVIAAAPGKDRALTAAERTKRRNVVVVKGGGPAAVRAALSEKRRQGERGPQRSPTKLPVTVRYSPEIVAYFKATGSGWQTRMNDVLGDWVAKHGAN
jgi:uncharacterized protein (DUF4415 family)